MDLSEKIKQILVLKNISPSLFADEIGIQRSSISHILAGRNKPSLDIVQKVVKRFPDLGLNWILDGVDLPDHIKPGAGEDLKLAKNESVAHLKPKPEPAVEPYKMKLADTHVSNENRPEGKVSPGEKNVERIVIFYSDGTFQEYKESK